MNRVLWLASIAACLLIGGCAEPAGNPTTASTSSTSTSEASFDFIADKDFEPLIASQNVVVANFTADW